MSLSSDYFDDDPEFLKALAEVELPGDITCSEHKKTTQSHDNVRTDSTDSYSMPPATQPCLKRRRSPSPVEGNVEEERRMNGHGILAMVDEEKSQTTYLASDTYGASTFGGFGQYMHRKRAKLQVQNAALDIPGESEQASDSPSARIFSGLQIYINGHTEPSVQELRKLIVQHGGIFHAYLDKKSLVTHILTCSLTPAKMREFQYMKVVKPEWLLESIKAGVLLPWHEFRFKVVERPDESQGKRAPQQSLYDTFGSSRSSGVSSSAESDLAVSPVSRTADLQKPSTSLPAEGPSTPSRSRAATRHMSNPNSPVRLLHTTDPSTPEQAERVPGYAADRSNAAAERAMADPAWRAAHTSVAPDFIEGYYRNSRLHHLSTWKAELKNLVTEAQERAEKGTRSGASEARYGGDAVTKIVRENMGGGKDWDHKDVSMRGAQLIKKSKGKEKATDETIADERVIMHCDFDSFFVSAGLVDRPHMRGKPVVVCHSQGNQGGQSSTSEIASASYEAREFGIKSGMSLQQARKLCPTVLTMPYEFQRYKQFSLQFYTILMAHADDLQAVSVDEALIDVTSSVRRIRTEISLSQEQGDSSDRPASDPAKEFAEAIRAQVRTATGCEVSIGIAHNIILARLASRRAKPAGSYHLLPSQVPDLMSTLDIDDLHGFGHASHQKALEKLGTTSLADLAKMSKAVLCDALGKGTGEVLFKAIRGIDEKRLESDKPRRSVSCDINYGIRFETNEQAETFIYQLSEEVSRRLESISMAGRSLTLKVLKRDPSAPVEAPKFMGHGICETFTKQTQLIAPAGRATSDDKIIGEHAWRLLRSLSFDPKELRGIGIQVQKLEKVGANDARQGQAILPFKPATSPEKLPRDDAARDEDGLEGATAVDEPAEPSGVAANQPGEPAHDPMAAPSAAVQAAFDLPSFSQVDMSVFDALPADVRDELAAEYKRRSVTPALDLDLEPARGRRRSRSRSRSASVFPPIAKALNRRKIVISGTSNLKTNLKTNVKRITRQLAVKSRSSIALAQTKLFSLSKSTTTRKDALGLSSTVANSVKLRITEEDLRKLDIDPEVFVALPAKIQREQLALARHLKAPLQKPAVTFVEGKKLKQPRKVPLKGPPGIVIPPPPPPYAVHPPRPTLKQQGPVKGSKVFFEETEDVQNVIEKWFEAFAEKPPNGKDVEFFAKWLVRCVDGETSTDGGVERAIKVMKWWLILLRRDFGVWERASVVEEQDSGEAERAAGPFMSEDVGKAWWAAFRHVKKMVDETARKKFGGCLSLR